MHSPVRAEDDSLDNLCVQRRGERLLIISLVPESNLAAPFKQCTPCLLGNTGGIFVNEKTLPIIWIPDLLRSSPYFAWTQKLLISPCSHVFLVFSLRQYSLVLSLCSKIKNDVHHARRGFARSIKVPM